MSELDFRISFVQIYVNHMLYFLNHICSELEKKKELKKKKKKRQELHIGVVLGFSNSVSLPSCPSAVVHSLTPQHSMEFMRNSWRWKETIYLRVLIPIFSKWKWSNMNFCTEEVCQQQEQDSKVNYDKYFPKPRSVLYNCQSPLLLNRIIELLNSWILISWLPKWSKAKLCVL